MPTSICPQEHRFVHSPRHSVSPEPPNSKPTATSIQFTLAREPNNQKAEELLEAVSGQDLNQALISTFALEKEINTFFRLVNPTVISNLRDQFPDLPDEPGPKSVFLKLRELRNRW